MGRLSLPGLRGDRLRLEPVTDAHLPHLVELNADPEVMRHVLGRAAAPEETYAEWARRLGPWSDVRRGLGYWAGQVEDRFVGWWSASSFAHDLGTAGLGYRLPRSAWGLGYATEGARIMVRQAFTAPGIERVVASTMAVNAGSRAVLVKAGLHHTGTWVQDREDRIDGWEQGEVLYEITRAEHAAQS